MVSFTGNEKGIAHKQIGKHGHCKYYKVTHNGNQLFVFNPSYGNYFHEPSHDKTAILFTDRSVYRPGQTVFFKAILYKPSGNGEKKLLGKTSVKVSLYDVNWQAVAEKKITSNEFGSIDGSFAIPQGLLNGRMTIDCHGYARTAVQVEEYKRPTFEVKFEPVAENFVLNKPVKISGNAKALSGYAIDNANIQYRVVRNTRHRYYYRWWRPLKEETREISSGVLKTDEKGNFNIEFMALADDVKDDQKIYTYTVTADVTDINGETRSASTDVHISNKPLLIKTNLKEKIYSGSLNNYTIETTNLNGEPTPATLHVEISSLEAPNKILRRRRWNDEIDVQTLTEAEFRKDFPLDEYNNELNPENFKELKTLSRYELNPEENKKLNLSSLKQSGYYKIKLTAKDQQGITVENVRYVYLFGDDPVKISSMDDWLAVVKKSGEPGENVAFHIAGAHENSHVYCELMHKNRIVESKWVKTGANPIKLTYPVKEEHRGGFTLQFSMVQDNRIYKSTQRIIVPYTNKMLDVELSTFRDQLLPGENETWTMLVKNKEGEKEDAEIVASLYDASLDFILPHRWPGPETIYSQYVDAYTWRWTDKSIEQLEVSREYHQKSYPTTWQYKVFYTDINWYNETYRKTFYANASSYGNRPLMVRGLASVSEPDVDYELNEIAIIEDDLEVAESEMVFMSADYTVVGFGKKAKNEQPAKDGAIKSSSSPDMPEVKVRTNFNETAFFYPCLRTNEKGETLIEFTIPEALTRWKLLSFAHTKDLKAGSYSNELITQKKVAISANPPRFFRENDKIEFRAKVNNLTEEELSGQAQLELYDALTMKPIDHIIKSEKSTRFEIASDGSVALGWQLSVPEDVQAIVYRVKTQAGTHSDGEEKTIPVLKNSMLVTETLPFSVRAKQEKSLTFERLANNNSTTLKNHRLTLEFTSAPAWYAVQALPYIMEYPYECAEQTFSRYYANTLATTIVNKTPRIKEIFNLWKMSDSKALVSNLEKNQELKQVLLEETPWVLHAKSETERKKRIGLLFDLNRMSSEMTRAFNKLKNIQNTDGGFPWFKGFSSSRYITQHLVSGMAHLVKLDAMQEKNKKDTDRMIKKGLAFLDYETWKDYDALIRNKAEMEKKQIGSIQLHYLYACSFSKHKPGEGKRKTAFEYYLSQAEKFWKEFTTYEKAMAALILHRNGKEKEARAVIRSLKEYAQQSEELGMYWKDNVAGYFWYQAPIETQAMLIEAFDEVAADKQSVEEMKIWLLRNKQTNDWKTTKATSVAIYALLKTGSNLLDESRLLEVKIAGRTLADVAEEEVVPEAGTGYVKTSWNGSNITKDMGRLEVKNPNNSGIAWGAMYWQYFEQLDKITAHETNLKMNKQLFLRTLTDKGEELQPLNDKNVLKVGDLVRVRMELRADRDYEYVHLKDMRASGFEPVSTLSGCRFQGGLWYYESIKDASTNFFITYLRKGTYVFEYDLRVSHKGDFSNGITMFQCMYAPEFSSHSEGVRVIVK